MLHKTWSARKWRENEKTRSSWLHYVLRGDEALYWVSMPCLDILHKVEIWTGVTNTLRTDWLTDFERKATQLLIKYKSGALVTQCRGNGERMRKWRGNGEEMDREWENGERTRKWREIHSLHFLIFSFFPPFLSISHINNCLILLQNVKYGTFVANVTKNLLYALWENNSGSNSLRECSASCAGEIMILNTFLIFGSGSDKIARSYFLQ